jgi:hypothetical protein
MSDEPHTHDEAEMPADAVEDLAPEGEDQDVSGGALNAYLKIEGVQGESDSSSLKI